MVLEDLIEHNESHDCPVLKVNVDKHSDDHLCEIFNELRHDTTVERVWIFSEEDSSVDFGVKASLTLAAAISKHPAIKELSFTCVGRISCFGALTVAIQRNPNLSSLGLYNFLFSLAQMAELEWLLAENGLESLDLMHWHTYHEDDLCIAQGLCSNQSLKQLNIRCCPISYISLETMDAIPELLKGNAVIESIKLHDADIPPAFFSRMADAVTRHRSLIKCSFNDICGDEIGEIYRLIEANTGIKTLKLQSSYLGDDKIATLSSALRFNTSVEILDLRSTYFGDKGATALAEALRSNVHLKEINLDGNSIGHEGVAAIAQALTSNTTLTSLSINLRGERELNALTLGIPTMCGLKKLLIHSFHIKLTKQGAAAFLKGLERNTELESTTFMGWFYDPEREAIITGIMPKVELQMTLNRAGKRILKSESYVPDSLWPLILAKSSNKPDALYFFLREKPDVLINKAPPVRASRKRKRGWFSGWF